MTNQQKASFIGMMERREVGWKTWKWMFSVIKPRNELLGHVVIYSNVLYTYFVNITSMQKSMVENLNLYMSLAAQSPPPQKKKW